MRVEIIAFERTQANAWNEYRVSPETGRLEWRAAEYRGNQWNDVDLRMLGHRKHWKALATLIRGVVG